MTAENLSFEQLGRESRERSGALEQLIAGALNAVVEADGAVFFLVAVDVRSDLFYAPVTNIPYQTLQEVVAKDGELVLETIRNLFPVDTDAPTLLAWLYRAAKREMDAARVVFARLDPNGASKSILYCDRDGLVQECSEQPTGREVLLGAKVNRLIQEFRANYKGMRKMIFARARHGLATPTPERAVEIAQVGFLLAPPLKYGQASSAARAVVTASDTSLFATLTLLYDRERYYQKALRQAVSGSIIKYGEATDILGQVGMLRGLSRAGKYFVPQVVDVDPEEHQKPRYAWYQMSRFKLPSMADLLTSTGGLQDYEIIALVRGAFSHLRETYWLQDLAPVSTRMRAYMASALALAVERAGSASGSLVDRAQRVASYRPIKFPRGIDLFDASTIRAFSAFTAAMADKDAETIEVKLSWDDYSQSAVCQKPAVALAKIGRMIMSMADGTDCYRCPTHDGRLHGDSHLANLLVDASIPEDPLIVSIDPKELSINKTEVSVLYGLVGDTCKQNDFDAEMNAMSTEPAYDVASLLLSTACGYSLAYRRAFRIAAVKRSRGVRLALVQRPQDEINKLSETGGISGSQIVTVDAPVPKDSWRYHCIASNVILDEYIRLLRDTLSDAQVPSIRASLVRVWLLTIYHAFSVCDILWPREPDRAVAMFALATRSIRVGQEAVSMAIGTSFAEPSLAELRRVFSLTAQHPLE